MVGGTGLIGLAVGIAFRDITENFLASIFLSMQRPFETGDLVEVAEATGYTTNSNRREDFVVGIGYDDSINEAQEIARKVLADHPAVLNDSEPSVLVESLGTSTVNLRVYFWLNPRITNLMRCPQKRRAGCRAKRVSLRNRPGRFNH